MNQCYGFQQLFILCLLLLLPVPSLAASTISLNFAGNNSFLLSGNNLEYVGSIEATVSYDASSLANPRLVPTNYFAGATVTLTGDSGGTVRLTIASGKPLAGKGPFARLAFDPVGTSVGTIRSLTGRVYGSNGASQPATFDYTNPTPQLDPSDPDDWEMIKERESKGQSYLGGEVVYLPPEATVTESPEQSDKSAESKDAAAADGKDTAERTSESKESILSEKAAEPTATRAKSVLERFRLFQGKRTVKNLTALFDADPAASFRQDPPILLADGKGSVRVMISRVAPGKVPGFSFRSARCVSLRKISETEWLVAVKPDKGTLEAGIMLHDNDKPLEIPLTVAPKARVDLIRPGKVSEADFALFLKERGRAKAPRFDLNGDGKRDYLDHYIFTANYLVEQEKQSRKAPSARNKSGRKKAPGKGSPKKT